MAITSKEINLGQLSRELGNKGLIADFNDSKKKIISPAEGVEITESQLEAAIAAHLAIDQAKAQATVKAALLLRLGISEAEAKLLLA